jgi:hypothetical protein
MTDKAAVKEKRQILKDELVLRIPRVEIVLQSIKLH